VDSVRIGLTSSNRVTFAENSTGLGSTCSGWTSAEGIVLKEGLISCSALALAVILDPVVVAPTGLHSQNVFATLAGEEK
jgi:hypothetical protein